MTHRLPRIDPRIITAWTLLISAALVFLLVVAVGGGQVEDPLLLRNRAPLWMISPEYDSVLILNNSVPQEVSTRIVLYDEKGRELAEKDLLLAPRQTEILSLSEEFPIAGSASGSLVIHHSGRPHDVGAQVEILERAASATTDVASFEAEDFSSTTLAAVAASIPGEPESRLILVNASEEVRAFEITAGGAPRREGTLEPHESLSVALGELDASPLVGVEVDFSGQPGDLLGGVISEAGRGEALSFTALEDPGRRRSSRLTTTALFGRKAPSWRFLFWFSIAAGELFGFT